MADIRQLYSVDQSLLERLIVGYTSTEAYQVVKEETPDLVRFELRLIRLEQPFVKRYPLDEQMIAQYSALAAAAHAFGAFMGATCVGIAICDPRQWNSSLHVHEFHIAPDFHRQGIGRALMATVEEHARAEGMRRLVLEAQTSNAPAIRFYRALGFTLDAVDISLYGEDDLARGEVAVFMKKDVAQPSTGEASILHLDE
jgi:ribosomal protein S18 acetylase RimI-like enzyme